MKLNMAVILTCAAVTGTVVATGEPAPLNVAPAAVVTTSFVSGHETLAAINDGHDPADSRDHRHGAYGNWPEHGTQWVEYRWPHEVATNGIDVYWWADGRGVALPVAARLLYWNGDKFVLLSDKIGLAADRYSSASFEEIRTTRLRLEIDAKDGFSTGVIEWKVRDSGHTAPFPPTAHAGDDRIVVMPAVTHLHGAGKGIARPEHKSAGEWSKLQGPGDVIFADAHASDTTASFTQPGDYVLQFQYTLRGLSATDLLRVRVEEPPTQSKLNSVYVSRYKINSPFWNDRLKYQIVNWIPHCIAKLEDKNLPEGGIENFRQAAEKLRGEPAKPHAGAPWADAYLLNTAESMCVALTLDPQGDSHIAAAQARFRAKLEEWIPIILAAQEKDGYFQTRFTLGTAGEQKQGIVPSRWDPHFRGEHEGYVAGYFIEMGIAHHIATGAKDARLYDAARRLADCWVANLGPAPKKPWYDGHQEVEQALVRLGRYVNDQEGAGHGQKYIDLAKFLLDSRSHQGGGEYDQSHRPVTEQYAAVGHAVRAAYTYSAMADVAMETGDPAYWSAIRSIWSNLVNRKYYITGGIGSSHAGEAFGAEYSLPNNTAYVESCASCGLLFMQYKLNLATREAKYADLYETTLYNAILGDVDLHAENFTYTNPLDTSEQRYKWHKCPCCVGNIPRTLLMLPTWMYATVADSVYVNLFVGSTVDVGKVAGTPVQMVQTTDYPWNGKVTITVNPGQPAEFAVNIRSPRREVSELYSASPVADRIQSLKVNGQPVEANPSARGYVAISRHWKAGDQIELELPLPVQRITASEQVAATRGKVALRRGPLVYNIESVDQDVDKSLGSAELRAVWSPDVLGGVMAITGQSADGQPLLAIPNYARLNRGGRSLVWMKQ